jgi:hypothetical protein
LLRILDTTINAFGTLNWVTEEGWPRIPRKRLEEDVIEEASSSNVTNEAFRRELFKLFL